MINDRLSRLESKMDLLIERTSRTETKLEHIVAKVESIERKTIDHDNYTDEISARVSNIENIAIVPRKIFDFTWKLSLFIGAIGAVIYWIKG